MMRDEYLIPWSFSDESMIALDPYKKKLSRTDMQYFQCNRLNWAESDKICRILPEKFLNKIGMPKQMMIPGGKIYV